MGRNLNRILAPTFIGMFLCSGTLVAQRAPIGNWTASGNDEAHSGWQKSERVLSKDNTAAQFKFLWKIKLGPEAKDGGSFNEPLLAPRLINAQGFKDIVFSGATDTLYAVDSELGTLLWKKKFEAQSAAGPCNDSGLRMAMEPPVVINFAARRAPSAPGAALPTTPPPPPPPTARRLGAGPGGGFALKAIYVLTNDGILHGQVLTTGADYGPPVKFLPAAAAGASGLNIGGKTVYTVTNRNCSAAPNGLWSLDMTTADYPVASYPTGKVAPLGLSGPTIANGAAYLVTGSGTSDPAAGVYADSIVAINDKDLKPRDWYTPSAGKLNNVTPVAFTYKQKKLLAAPGPNGTYVLLDSESLGGSDHHTPLSQTAKISTAKPETWDSLAAWQDATGTAWVLASVSGPLASTAKFATANGATPHGSIVAFKVEEQGEKLVLTPAWTSQDMINPAAPRIANGVIIALAQGDPTSHAKLYVLDATTGKELYSSKETITTYSHLAGVSIGDSHAFFTTHDNTLYSFGIGIEH